MLDLAQIKLETIEEKEGRGVFVIEPLDPGLGHTIGNSLRRTLLSSLPGMAITQVKIDGVRHPFSTLSGMREDIIEFILNLKKVRIKSDSDKAVKLTLNITGPKEVTAADIKASSGAQIVNTKLVLAHLAAKAKLSCEMTAEKGEGYVPAEERAKGEIGPILIDAIFSPVTGVNYKVEATRVGRVTNFDKLTLEIITDGTIKPLVALKESAKILVDHFKIIYEPKKAVKEAQKTDESVMRANDGVMSMTIEELDLPVRVVNALQAGGIVTVEDFVTTPKAQLLKLKNLGAKSIDAVSEKLIEKGVEHQV